MDKKNKTKTTQKSLVKNHSCHPNKDPGAVYGLGLIGALFYFLSHATSFVTVLLGIVKAIFWPVLLIIKMLEFFQL
ncbi:MAG: hypothetical protein PHX34_05405 [Candidatus Shapirobacteria bacterium]|nr:hypothetical protein [Candidatus Shapirobacteria bacterium]